MGGERHHQGVAPEQPGLREHPRLARLRRRIERGANGEMFLCWPYKPDEDTSAQLKMCIGDEDFVVEAGSETVDMERGIRMALMTKVRSQQQTVPRQETVDNVVKRMGVTTLAREKESVWI